MPRSRGLCKRRVDEIASAHVLKVLEPIWTTKPETARRVKQRIGVVFDWALASPAPPIRLSAGRAHCLERTPVSRA
ncbi:phage integrase central domain-containing protein [Vineibacter terrae]|uniref:phage integrase central domain-containing protein n=1 Tax=Vineibacter terrae TaxID=2586908 RepID=UPI0039C9A473